MTTTPALSPAFAPTTHDYVVQCAAGTNSITFNLTTTSGSQDVTVERLESQAVEIQAPGSQYWVRCLPHDFPTITVNRPGNPAPGWYVTAGVTDTGGSSGLYAMILDGNGTPVWYSPAGGLDFQQLLGNTLSWGALTGPGTGADPSQRFTLYDLTTQTESQQPQPNLPMDPHELLQMSNGDRMEISTPLLSGQNVTGPTGSKVTAANIIDCVVTEVAPNGAAVWTWDAHDHISPSETTLGGPGNMNEPATYPTGGGSSVPAYDVYHCNSVDVDPSASDPSSADVLISSRNTSAVYRINRATGTIEWKLGGNEQTATLPQDHEPQLIPQAHGSGDEAEISGQHDARFRPGGGVALYDDHSPGPGVDNTVAATMGVARGVEFSIDTTAKKATPTFQYEQPNGLFSVATGSFRRSADGTDNIIGWGFREPPPAFNGPSMTEVNQNGADLMDITFPPAYDTYRVVKLPLSAFDANLLRTTAGLPRVQPTATAGWNSPGETTVYGEPSDATDSGATSPVSPGRNWIDSFWRGGDGNLWHDWTFDGGASWSGAASLGSGPLVGNPHAVSSASGRIDVFWKGADGGLWHDWFFAGGPWGGPSRLSPPNSMASDPYPVSFGPTGIDVFWKGPDNALWHSWYQDGPGWGGPQSLGDGPLGSDPHPVSAGTGRVDVFWTGQDSALWHAFFWPSGGWSGPVSQGSGPLNSDPHAVSSATGQIDVFWRGTDSALWHDWYADGSGWAGPQWLGGKVAAPPIPGTSGSGVIDVSWRTTDQSLNEARFIPGSGWVVGMAPSSTPLTSDPTPVSPGNGQMAVVAEAFDGDMWFQTSSATTPANAALTGPTGGTSPRSADLRRL